MAYKWGLRMILQGSGHEIKNSLGFETVVLPPTSKTSKTPPERPAMEACNDALLFGCTWISQEARQGSVDYKWDILLGGGFKYFLFSPPLGEDSHFE